MFDHLVESGSHTEDLKRKGGFLIGFTAIYLVLIFTGLIVGILLAPAIIDQQTLGIDRPDCAGSGSAGKNRSETGSQA